MCSNSRGKLSEYAQHTFDKYPFDIAKTIEDLEEPTIAAAARPTPVIKQTATAAAVYDPLDLKDYDARLKEFRAASSGQKKQGKDEVCITEYCWHCKKYHKYQRTAFKCVECDTPICQKDRSKTEPGTYQVSCLHEHLYSNDSELRCQGPGRKKNMKYPPLKASPKPAKKRKRVD